MNLSAEPQKILVVDDEAMIRDLLKRILEGGGYCCLSAANADRARRVLEREPVALLLCDIHMPQESGLELVREVKERYSDLGILMVTGVDDPATARIALSLGLYGYLMKPFQPSQILVSVANALRLRALELRERERRQQLEQAVAARTQELLASREKVRAREIELRAQKKELEEINVSLRVLLKKREEDREAMEQKILLNVKQMIRPYLDKLKTAATPREQDTYLKILETNLEEITSSFTQQLSSAYFDLTPTEIRVAQLTRDGRTSKEIADILGVSDNTVQTHRHKIRKKLGLVKQQKNLRSYLQLLG